MFTPSRALKKDSSTNCTTTFSTTLVVLSNKTRITALPAEMFPHTRNGFEIDPSQDNNHIRQKIIGDRQALNDSFMHVCWLFSNVSFTPLYKGVKVFQLEYTYIQHTDKKAIYTHSKARLSKHFKVHNLFCLHFKVTQNFLSIVHILEILQSQESKESVIDLYCEHH